MRAQPLIYQVKLEICVFRIRRYRLFSIKILPIILIMMRRENAYENLEHHDTLVFVINKFLCGELSM